MIRRLAVILSCFTVAAFAAGDIASAAHDPRLLADYVNSQSPLDFAALRTALTLKDPAITLAPCGAGECHAELLDVPGAGPEQAIVWLSHTSGGAFWLRYKKDASGAWRFLSASGVRVKFFTAEHKMVTAFRKPFLIVRDSGVSAKGASSQIESWFDLSLPRAKPVFAFTSEETHEAGTLGLVHLVKATAIAVPQGAAGQIRVEETVHFQADALDNTRSPFELGRGAATAYYVRQPDGDFKFAPALSSAPKNVIDSIFDIATEQDGMTNEQFLKFDIAGLRRLAAAPMSPVGQWLSKFLALCKDTPEKTELLGLLQ